MEALDELVLVIEEKNFIWDNKESLKEDMLSRIHRSNGSLN